MGAKKLDFDHYVEWNLKRCAKVVAHYGIDFFKGKTLLDVGTLHGENGNTFYELGAIVTIQDAREEYVTSALEKYPHLNGYVHDLNDGLGTDDFYDIILHIGVLYHLESAIAIADACRQCNHLILETQVCDSAVTGQIDVVEDPSHTDHSYTGKGIRPSPSFVEGMLDGAGFEFVRVSTGLECSGHTYDWTARTDGKYERMQPDGNAALRAMWFCKRRL